MRYKNARKVIEMYARQQNPFCVRELAVDRKYINGVLTEREIIGILSSDKRYTHEGEGVWRFRR